MKLSNTLSVSGIAVFLILFSEGGSSFDSYSVQKSLTPLGWALLIIVSLVLLLGAASLARNFLKKPKLK